MAHCKPLTYKWSRVIRLFSLSNQVHDYLKKRIERSGTQKKIDKWNKDEEIRRAVEMAKYSCTHSLYQMSDNEQKAERAFRDSHYKSCENGGKYLYELTGTGIGTAITIKCPVCGEEKDITDHDCW